MQITDQMKAELINAGWIPPDTVREKTLKWFITSADQGAVGSPVERPVRPACKRCAMWEYIDAADEAEGMEYEDVGTCCRWPPVRKPENKALLEANGCAELRAHTPRDWAQPITLSTDWCGEFRPNTRVNQDDQPS